jgi:hypothetical protein
MMGKRRERERERERQQASTRRSSYGSPDGSYCTLGERQRQIIFVYSTSILIIPYSTVLYCTVQYIHTVQTYLFGEFSAFLKNKY